MATWPTHRKRTVERKSRIRWEKRKAALERRARRVKPNDTQRLARKAKPQPEREAMDPQVQDSLRWPG